MIFFYFEAFNNQIDIENHKCESKIQPKASQNSECPFCRKFFFTEAERDVHYKNEHSQLALICDICGGNFNSFKVPILIL